ncbi:helix-turn-helix domain-containing protein [Flavobacterium sp. 102]|uniref:helix-turn-helix domain-containing protein n=1 Tax=Flavobacterium sp. 102 TaxID=2135623 RepID=UPI000EB3C637|nr:helix-turn-helix domain-containing protein [Flavobacterium sp. 102]RKS01159.1 transposase [Flavobacterium sp. 102]RKS02100.1 transposase [Flavobacterium sp. 102]RKS03347.1 transposase [Flavobacterium sp. 102]RKS03351.1 transposase [Flavobacterium sp. 102]RKS03705.1 transposase [Flavobacterium sp. 102]
MSRKIKYDIDFKKSIVEKVINGKSGCKSIAIEFSLQHGMVRRWVSFYHKYGIEGLKPIKNSYSAEFKLKAINEMRNKYLSLSETCILFKIPSIGSLMKWIAIYDSEGSAGLALERRGKHKAMPKKSKKALTREEELLEELADLKAENAYLKKLHALVQSEKEKEEKRKSSKN